MENICSAVSLAEQGRKSSLVAFRLSIPRWFHLKDEDSGGSIANVINEHMSYKNLGKFRTLAISACYIAKEKAFLLYSPVNERYKLSQFKRKLITLKSNFICNCEQLMSRFASRWFGCCLGNSSRNQLPVIYTRLQATSETKEHLLNN